MATNPAERFANIFAITAKPPLPDPSQPHIADIELQKPKALEPVCPEPPMAQEFPQIKRKVHHENEVNASDILFEFEDEDDSIDALQTSGKCKLLDLSKHHSGRKRWQDATGKLGKQNETPFESLLLPSDRPYGVGVRYAEHVDKDKMQPKLQLPTADVDGNKVTGHFCPLSLVSKFPYKFMKDEHDKVSKQFFAADKFYAREWDIYCLQPAENMYLQPTLFLPLNQVQQLLNEISSAFKIDVNGPLKEFTVSFFDDKSPQPVFLGKTRSRDDYNGLQNSIPPAAVGHGICPEGASLKVQCAFENFAAKCQLVLMANKKGKTDKKEKKVKERWVKTRESASALRRVQRYFGLRPADQEPAGPDQSLTWDEQQKWEVEQAKKCDINLQPLDVTKQSPFPFEKDIVFICFDVEANEHARHLITEIGISTLDVEDIVNIAPGQGGYNWIQQIRSRHFRIKECSHIRNKTFVFGNPDDFLFGTSEFVGLKDAADEVDACFSFPFSAGFQHDGTKRFEDPSSQQGPKDRHIVLVGHAVQTDIDYLSKLGSKIFPASQNGHLPAVPRHPVLNSIQEALDIEILYKTLKNEKDARSLGSVMLDLGLDAWSLHNGGNDARYTMECLVGMAVKARQDDDEKAKKEQMDKARVAKEVEEANRKWNARATAESGSRSDDHRNANTDGAAEAAALKAKFLDPAQTPSTAVSTAPPGRGRHYGSENDLDEMSDDDDDAEPVASRSPNGSGQARWFDMLVQASEEKLKLDAGDYDDDGESKFEM